MAVRVDPPAPGSAEGAGCRRAPAGYTQFDYSVDGRVRNAIAGDDRPAGHHQHLLDPARGRCPGL